MYHLLWNKVFDEFLMKFYLWFKELSIWRILSEKTIHSETTNAFHSHKYLKTAFSAQSDTTDQLIKESTGDMKTELRIVMRSSGMVLSPINAQETDNIPTYIHSIKIT
ncbi:uncharacterized protein LOC143909237 [Arctopsyche grandis]|uniref:uncharacterized protein LOC143909237 n=1 Tax=Arctopsyche grandis TaxID=121162 RepID=UPI00406D6B4D